MGVPEELGRPGQVPVFLTRSGKNRQAGGLGGLASPLGAEGPVTSGAVATETTQVTLGRFVVGLPG